MLIGEKPNDEEQRQMQDITLEMGHHTAAALCQQPAWRQWNELGR